MNGFDPTALQRYCKEKCGVVLGTGIGDLQGQAFRIAHMGHINAPMVLGTLGVVEVALNRAEDPARQGRNRSRDRVAGGERGDLIPVIASQRVARMRAR